MASKKLLVIEDSPEIAKLVSLFAKKKGYEVLSADEGQQGLLMAMDHKPDVLIIDIMLPGMDGRDILARLRNKEWIKNSVVLFLTARDTQSDRLVGLELGADDYITKPVIMEHLFLKIEHLLAKKQAGAEA